MRKSNLEEKFELILRAADLPQPIAEYKFHPKRRWRFDFAWPDHMLAVELEGGVWAGGRHTRGAGFVADCDKYNAAVVLGWRVLRFTTSHIEDFDAVIYPIRAILKISV